MLLGFPNAQSADIFRVGGNQFELRVNQKIFNQPFEPLAGLVDFLAHFGDLVRVKGGGGGGQQFGVGNDAVERRAHFVRHHEADVVAQAGELAFGLVAHGLRLFEARIHGGVKRVGRERLGQVIVRAEFHAVPHAGIVGQAGHQNERDGGGGRFVAQRGQGQITIHLFHVDVTKDEIGQFFARDFDALGAVGRLDHVETLLLQRQMHHFAQPLFIVNDQDFFHQANALEWSNNRARQSG